MTILTFLQKLTRVERILFVIAIAGVIAGLVGYATIRFTGRGEVSPAPGGAWREVLIGQPTYVNPVLARAPADIALTHLLFAPLSDLADTIEATGEGKTIRIHLKEGLLWSDGKELNSDDVLFTIASIQDPDARSPRAGDWQGVKTERVSQLELVLTLPVVHAGFTETAKALRVAPRHLFNEIPVANWKLSEYMTSPVASGPYLLSSRRIERDGFITSVELRANPRFAGTAPFIGKITVRFVTRPEDGIALFNNGGADGLAVEGVAALDSIRRPYQLIRYQSPTLYGVFWNQNANPVLADSAVRKALALVTERKMAGPLPLSFDTAATTTSFSADEARAVLKDAGWEADDEGILGKKIRGEKKRLAFILLVPDIAPLPEAASSLRTAWLTIGVDAKIETVPLEELRTGALKNRTYEAILFGNTFDASGDLYPFWHSSQKFHPGLNLALYGNKDTDALLETIRGLGNSEERVAKRGEAVLKIMETNPALFLFPEEHLYVAKKELKGAGNTVLTTAADRFTETARWYLRTKR